MIWTHQTVVQWKARDGLCNVFHARADTGGWGAAITPPPILATRLAPHPILAPQPNGVLHLQFYFLYCAHVDCAPPEPLSPHLLPNLGWEARNWGWGAKETVAPKATKTPVSAPVSML